MADRAPHVVLVGMMGSGKSTVGRLVATRLGRPFADADDVIEAATGATVAELFAERGEEAFRRLEAGVLTGLLDAGPPAVIATGGGAVLDPGTRDRLRSAAAVVWLRAAPATLAARVGADPGRPLLAGGDAGAVLARLAAERAPRYAEVASAVVDVDDRTPEQVAEAVLAVAPVQRLVEVAP